MGKEDSFHIQQMLDTSLQYIPDSIDSERFVSFCYVNNR